MAGRPMGLGETLFAAVYDLGMARVERTTLARLRGELIARARGRVIELGPGTGANLRFYGEAVEDLVLVEPSDPMRRRLSRRAAGLGRRVTLVNARSESLPIDDAAFDTAVSTLHLCSVGDVARALAEIARVLKPGGALLFLEHVRSADLALARWQDRLSGAWAALGRGCRCNRPILDALRPAGLTLTAIEHGVLRPAPAIVRPLAIGVATRPATGA